MFVVCMVSVEVCMVSECGMCVVVGGCEGVLWSVVCVVCC